MSVDLARARRASPARLDVGRAGTRPRTDAWLAFRRDHAAARDAVWASWSPAFEARLAALGFVVVDSAAGDRTTFIREPPRGRRLAPGALDRIVARSGRLPTFQLVVSDGLSARAAETHLDGLWPGLVRHLGALGMLGVPVAVRNGRVAAADAIGAAVGALVVVHLIGERPGLGSADSLGCYLTFRAGPATTDADRKCVSNIRPAGLAPTEAGATIAGLCRRILEHGGSGTDLLL